MKKKTHGRPGLHWLRLDATALTALLALASAAVLLTGCATPGEPLPPMTQVQAAALDLDDAATPAPPARWWTMLGDTQLTALVDRALRDQPSLALARSRVDRAWALAQATEAADAPQLRFSAEATRQRYTEHGLVPYPIAGTVRNTGTVQLGGSWSPDWYGQHAAALAASLGQAHAAQADMAAAANTLAAQVTRAYVALARLVAQREVTERTLAQRQEMRSLTAQRVAAGLDTRVEAVQADAALPDTRASIEALDEQITLARHQLAALTGQAPGALDGLAPQLAALLLQPLPAHLGADLLARRPDIAAARFRVEAAGDEVKVARTAFYPDINLTAFVGLNAIGLDQVFKGGSQQAGITPALHLPVFDGGRLRAQHTARQAELNGAIAQYNAAVLDAVREARDAVASLQSLARQRHEQALALDGARSAHDLAMQRYRAGLGSYLIVLNTESQWLAQRRQAVELQAREIDTGVALARALGGGWSADAALLAAR